MTGQCNPRGCEWILILNWWEVGQALRIWHWGDTHTREIEVLCTCNSQSWCNIVLWNWHKRTCRSNTGLQVEHVWLKWCISWWSHVGKLGQVGWWWIKQWSRWSSQNFTDFGHSVSFWPGLLKCSTKSTLWGKGLISKSRRKCFAISLFVVIWPSWDIFHWVILLLECNLIPCKKHYTGH